MKKFATLSLLTISLIVSTSGYGMKQYLTLRKDSPVRHITTGLFKGFLAGSILPRFTAPFVSYPQNIGIFTTEATALCGASWFYDNAKSSFWIKCDCEMFAFAVGSMGTFFFWEWFDAKFRR